METTVLLVEDDVDTREMYSEFMTYCGLHVVPARDGRDALQLVKQGVPDVVVTDLAMPVMDGFELARRLRTDQTTCEVPVIAVSGQAAAGLAERAAAAGCDVLYLKPCLPDTLVEAIQSILAEPPHRGNAVEQPGR